MFTASPTSPSCDPLPQDDSKDTATSPLRKTRSPDSSSSLNYPVRGETGVKSCPFFFTSFLHHLVAPKWSPVLQPFSQTIQKQNKKTLGISTVVQGLRIQRCLCSRPQPAQKVGDSELLQLWLRFDPWPGNLPFIFEYVNFTYLFFFLGRTCGIWKFPV